MPQFVPHRPRREMAVDAIVTVHYFEYAKNYVFEGEKHDFWELLYVDKGEVEVMADSTGYRLRQGDMIFHKPDEFHNVFANGVVAPQPRGGVLRLPFGGHELFRGQDSAAGRGRTGTALPFGCGGAGRVRLPS